MRTPVPSPSSWRASHSCLPIVLPTRAGMVPQRWQTWERSWVFPTHAGMGPRHLGTRCLVRRAARHAPPGRLGVLGRAAQVRGQYRAAAQLWKDATRHGDTRAATELVRHMLALDTAFDRTHGSACHDAAHWAAR